MTYREGGVFNRCPEEALWGRNQFCLCEKEENLRTAALKEQNFLKRSKRMRRANAVAPRG